MSQIAKRRSLLSYDLWWFRLDVSRRLMTQSMLQLFLEIARLLEKSDLARRIFSQKLLEAGMLKTRSIGRGIAIEFNPIFSTVEGHLFVYAFPEGILDAFIDILGLEGKREVIRRAATNEEAELAVSRGLIPILLPYELSEQASSIPVFQG